MAKYLTCRDSPAKRKLFRQTRKAIGQASTYAQKHMIDAKGVLNPGLMPQKLDDLQRIAPARTEVDDVLVERWNRVAEVWRDQPEFRTAVLRYATSNAHRDPASTAFWPEVVYPLIERARWHRRIRTRTEAIWDYLCGRFLHVPDAGVVLDRAIDRVVPAPLVAQLDESMNLLTENPRLDDDEADPFARARRRDRPADRLAHRQPASAWSSSPPNRPSPTRTRDWCGWPTPTRSASSRASSTSSGRRPSGAPEPGAGPARRQAGQPPPRPGRPLPAGRHSLDPRPRRRPDRHPGHGQQADRADHPHVPHQGSASKPLLAIWVYRDNSLAIAHLDFMNSEHYVLWHAPKSHQLNFDDPADLNHELYTLGMEVPDQLDKVLSRWFKPSVPR